MLQRMHEFAGRAIPDARRPVGAAADQKTAVRTECARPDWSAMLQRLGERWRPRFAVPHAHLAVLAPGGDQRVVAIQGVDGRSRRPDICEPRTTAQHAVEADLIELSSCRI